MALKLAVLVGFRPKNIAEMRWEDIQSKKIDGQAINFVFIEADNMKMSRDFRQPLSEQAYNILMDMKKYNGGGEYVFYSTSSKCRHISTDSLSKALRVTLGYNGIDNPKQVTHGFRKSVRTYLSTIESKYSWSNCLVWTGCTNNFISFSLKHIRRFIKNLRFNSIPFYDSVKWCFHF